VAGQVYGDIYTPFAVNAFDSFGRHVIFEEIGRVVDASNDYIVFESDARIIDNYYRGMYVQLISSDDTSLRLITAYTGKDKVASVHFPGAAPQAGDKYRIVYALHTTIYPETGSGNARVTGSPLARVVTPEPAFPPFAVATFTDLTIFDAQTYSVNLTFGALEIEGNEWYEVFSLPQHFRLCRTTW